MYLIKALPLKALPLKALSLKTLSLRPINLLPIFLALAGCGDEQPATSVNDTAISAVTNSSARINAATLISAAKDTTSWLTYNRSYDGQRYSPAAQINQSNVAQLGLAWFADLDTQRGQEATPLLIDGNIYISTAWSKVKAYDGATGKPLWDYDPEVPGATAVKACCDVVNRGLAAWGDKLYVGTLDGRLIALNRATGKVTWSVATVDQSQPYTITGAPLVVKGKVIIGNGGAEMGVRGYITAYDADSGKQLWRFYTVPDNPTKGPQPAYLEAALPTWNGEWWQYGGGGTVWDAMAYDPELDLLYIGVGNGSPWNQAYRSPGGGDNLYLSSIVAIKPDSGEYVWHYQTTPGETWDFTATQHIILADLKIEGSTRKVLMQAPKNGFFYVIDRETGEFISANNFVPVNWATGIDPATGRPLENPEARYSNTGKPFLSTPGATGAHSWHPMAYNPEQQLVYIPANIAMFPYIPQADWKPAAKGFNVGINMGAAAMPADAAIRAQARAATKGALIAWDPVTQTERWRADFAGPNNGGVLATAGDLVFQGNATGEFAAYAARSGAKQWSFDAQTGVVAAPITYTIGSDQYVAVLAGWGGVWALAPGALIDVSGPVRNISRLLVFKLNGSATLPPPPALATLPLNPTISDADAATVTQGGALFGRYCSTCHGDAAVGSVIVPDLRRSSLLGDASVWQSVVHDGAFETKGMVGWKDVLSKDEIETVRQYVIHRANEDNALER